MKVKGSQWMAFLADSACWPEGAYMDDVLIHVNGRRRSEEGNDNPELSAVPVDADVVIETGFAVLGGAKQDLVSMVRRWLDDQSVHDAFGGARTFRELMDLCRSGAQFPVEFQKMIEDAEGYLECGMRAVLSSPVEDHGDFLVFQAQLVDFEAFNDAVASANYFDKSGNPTLTAKQAGLYPDNNIERVYADADRALVDLIKPVESDRSALLIDFSKSGNSSYIRWLEGRVLALGKGLKG